MARLEVRLRGVPVAWFFLLYLASSRRLVSFSPSSCLRLVFPWLKGSHVAMSSAPTSHARDLMALSAPRREPTEPASRTPKSAALKRARRVDWVKEWAIWSEFGMEGGSCRRRMAPGAGCSRKEAFLDRAEAAYSRCCVCARTRWCVNLADLTVQSSRERGRDGAPGRSRARRSTPKAFSWQGKRK